ISRWATSEQGREEVTLMVDTEEQLDLIDRIAPKRGPLKVALELDAAYYPSSNGRIGAARSPLTCPAQVAELAAEVHRRTTFILDGLMGYESQIASVPDGGFTQIGRAHV